MALAQASPCSLAQADTCCMATWISWGPWAATEAGAKYLCPLQAHVSPVLLLLNVYLLQLPCSPWWLLMGVTDTLL